MLQCIKLAFNFECLLSHNKYKALHSEGSDLILVKQYFDLKNAVPETCGIGNGNPMW